MCTAVKFAWGMCTVAQSLSEKEEKGNWFRTFFLLEGEDKEDATQLCGLGIRLNCLRHLQGLWRWAESENFGQLVSSVF